MMCGLAYSLFSRIMDELMKLPRAFTSSFIHYQYLVLNMVMAEYPASHEYDAAKRINIRGVFSAKAGYLSFIEIQKFVGFLEVNFPFRESSQPRLIWPLPCQCDCFGIGYILPNQQVFVEKLFFVY